MNLLFCPFFLWNFVCENEFQKIVFKVVHTIETHLSVTFSNEKIRNVKNVDFLTKFMIKSKPVRCTIYIYAFSKPLMPRSGQMIVKRNLIRDIFLSFNPSILSDYVLDHRPRVTDGLVKPVSNTSRRWRWVKPNINCRNEILSSKLKRFFLQ